MVNRKPARSRPFNVTLELTRSGARGAPTPASCSSAPNQLVATPNRRARYADPDSGRMVKTTLDPTGLPTAEARRDWAIRKARSISKRKMDPEREPGTTLRYEPIAPIVACALLTGMRFGEVMSLEWKQVDFDALGSDGAVVGEIHLSAATKTKRARTVGLEVSPTLRKLLAAMQVKAATKRKVFASTRGTAEAAAKRIRREFWGASGVHVADTAPDLRLLLTAPLLRLT